MANAESAAAPAQDQRLEVGHVLFMDIVGYSRLRLEEQKRSIEALQQLVRTTKEFQTAINDKRILRLPTGDGMALVFFVDPEAPLRCAVQLSRALRQSPFIPLRMGVHSGLVYRVDDINANLNVAGGGVNIAQRVMDCGDAGHILVSEDSARLFAQVKRWADLFHDIGRTRVKHGLKLHLYSMYVSEVGNPHLPHKLKQERVRKVLLASAAIAPLTALTVFFVFRTLHKSRPVPAFVIPVQLTENPSSLPVSAAAISPNGAYLAYVDSTGIYVLDMRSGEKKELPRPENDTFIFASTNWDLAWSADSTRIYAAAPSDKEANISLWVLTLLGTSPKKVLENVEAPSVSTDGSIAYIDATTEQELWIAGANGEAPRRISAVGGDESFAQVAWAPRGERLAYIQKENDHDVLGTIDPKNGQTTEVLAGMTLAAGPQKYYSGLCWSPDDRIIFVAANPAGRRGSNLWAVEVDPVTGRKLREASALTKEPATVQSDLSTTSDGKQLAFVRYDESDRALVARLAPSGESLTDIDPLPAEEGNNWVDHWTPDSSFLLFTTDRRKDLKNVFKQALNDESPQPLHPADEIQVSAVAAWGTQTFAYWSWPTAEGESPSKIFLNVLNTSDGSVRSLPEQPNTDIACALKNETCVLESDAANTRAPFSVVDLKNLTTRLLPPPQPALAAITDWDISPDAKTIAVVDNDTRTGSFWLISTEDGKVSRVKVPDWAGLDLVAWSADGTGLYLGSDTAKASALLRSDLAGHARVLWKNRTEGLESQIAPSPNGQYVAFTTTSTADSNVWALDNF